MSETDKLPVVGRMVAIEKSQVAVATAPPARSAMTATASASAAVSSPASQLPRPQVIHRCMKFCQKDFGSLVRGLTNPLIEVVRTQVQKVKLL